MKIFKKRKGLLICLGVLLSFLLAGCTSTSSLESTKNGFVKGQVEFVDQGTVTSTSLTIDQVHKLEEEYDTVELKKYTMETAVSNPSTYIIKFSRNLSVDDINTQILQGKGKVLKKLAGNHTYKVKLNSEEKSEIIDFLQQNSLVSYLEPDYAVHIQSIPNDPEYGKQWNLKMLDLEQTWEKFKGSSSVTVAVLDTGILPDHPDLKSQIISGYDFIDNDNDPTDTSPDFSHGTHVAGIIGAETNNYQGIAGVNWRVQIICSSYRP